MILVTCRELTEMATSRKEGRLRGSDRAGVQLHLAWCSRCRRYLEQMDLTVEALHELEPEPVPEAAEAALLAAFERTRRR